jgi:cytoskeletal protein CcmA (bactofilin family)
MWKKNPEEEPLSQPSPRDISAPLGQSLVRPAAAAARVGSTLSFKGELSGDEDLVIDGEIEGNIELGSSRLTVGPEGRVQADIRAREIIIQGSVRGKLRATDRLQITRTGNLMGELVAGRIVIEDGAYFKGSIDIQKPEEERRAPAEPPGQSFRISAAPPTPGKDKLQ